MSDDAIMTSREGEEAQPANKSPAKSITTALKMETSLESAAASVAGEDNKGSVVTILDQDSEGGSETKGTVSDPQTNTTTVPAGDTRPYSAFTKRQKWSICALASLAAIFGPISSNIFVPAIPQVGKSFGISTQRVDLALTIYLYVCHIVEARAIG
jgi:hypothetical protein